MSFSLVFFGVLAASATPNDAPFPERTPGMIEACLVAAADNADLSKSKDSYKYICTGTAAEDLWQFLENAKVEAWEQKVDGDVWLSREFPLGACFKRTRHEDGTEAPSGLSCTIWIPRKR